MQLGPRIIPNDNFNRYYEELLARYTRRNQQAVTQHLESLCGFLRQEGNHVVQTMFGDSVRRHTFATGISDVDVLLVVSQSSLANQPLVRIIGYVRDTIQQRLNQNPVAGGNLVVTVRYSGGVEIQTLSAIRTSTDGIRLPNPVVHDEATWRTPRDLRRSSAGLITQETGGGADHQAHQGHGGLLHFTPRLEN